MSLLNKLRYSAFLLILFGLFILVATGCTQEDNFGPPPGAVVEDGDDTAISRPAEVTPDYDRTPPPVKMPEYVGENQQTNNDGSREALVDMTNVSQGYIAASCTADTRTRLRVTHNDTGGEDLYELDNDGTMNFYPLTRGDGSYTFVVYVNLQEDEYLPFVTAQASVTLADQFAPYTIPTRLVRYDEDSACVQQSYESAAHSATNLEVAKQVLNWVVENVSYDTEKAELLGGKPSAYEPFPDETYQTRKGICYDYASLTAAMLRANGIPTKLVKGNVTDPEGNDIYHAWNLVWLEEAGWVLFEIPTTPNDWTRIDPTFSASAGDSISQFVGDGKNYTALSEY